MVSWIKNKGTYNQLTGTYTSPTGDKYSMNLENAKKIGAVVVHPLISGRSSSSSSRTTSPIVSTTTQTINSSSKPKPSLLDTKRVEEILQKQEQAKLSLLTRRSNPQQYGFTRVSYGAGQTTPNFTAVPTKAFRVITSGGRITIIKNGQTRTYTGNAFIPELNMTANAFNNQIENQYKVSRGNYRFDNVLYSDLKQTEQKNRQLQNLREIKELGTTYASFQRALQKQVLPKGYSWQYKDGQIVAINGPTYQRPLEELPNITPFLVSDLKKVFFKNIKLFIPTGRAPALKGLEMLSGKKYIDKTNNQRYIEYQKLGGKLTKEKYLKEVFSNSKDKIIKQSILNELKFHIANPIDYGDLVRVNLLLTVITFGGASLKSTVITGAVYGGTLGLASDIAKTQYNLNLKQVLGLVVKNYGIGAAQGLLAGILYKGAGKVLSGVSKSLPVVFGEVAGTAINKTAKMLISNGLRYLGISYVTNTSYKVTGYLKNIAVGDKKYGIKGLSQTTGQISGFALSNISQIVKKVKNMKYEKKVKELDPYIKAAQKFREGYSNGDYFKIKNAQPTDFKSGKIKVDKIGVGKLSKISASQQREIINIAKQNGIKLSTESEIYVQQIRVRSDVPKMNAYIKFLKSLLTTKPLKSIPNYPSYSTYTRYGVVYGSQINNGVVRSVSIEWSITNGKVSYVGFKSGIGAGTKAFVKNYMKTRTVSQTVARESFKLRDQDYTISITRPMARVRLSDVYVVKGKKILSSKNNQVVLTKYNIKRAFINGKPLTPQQSVSVRNALIKDYKAGSSKNIESFLSKLYKDKSFLQTQKVFDIRLVSKSNNVLRVDYKYNNVLRVDDKYFISRSKSVLNIPTKPIPKITFEAPNIKIKGLNYDVKAQTYTPSNKVQIKNKLKTATVQQTKQILNTAITNTQTIIKPAVRSTRILSLTSQVKVLQNIGVISLVVQKSVLRNKLQMASRELSKVLNAQLKVSKLTNSQRTQLKDKQTSVLVSLGKTINMITAPVTNLIIPIRTPRPTKNPEDIIEFPKLDFDRFKSISQRADKFSSGFNPGILVNRKIKSLTRLPLTFKKALPVALYGLLNSRSKISVLVPDNRRFSKSTLERQTKVTQDYFSRNRLRVTLRYDNNKKIFYLIKK